MKAMDNGEQTDGKIAWKCFMGSGDAFMTLWVGGWYCLVCKGENFL